MIDITIDNSQPVAVGGAQVQSIGVDGELVYDYTAQAPSAPVSYMIKIGANVMALKAGTAGDFTLTDQTKDGPEVLNFENVVSVTSLNTAILVINPPASAGGGYTYVAKGIGSVVVQVKIYNAAGTAVITDSAVIGVS